MDKPTHADAADFLRLLHARATVRAAVAEATLLEVQFALKYQMNGSDSVASSPDASGRHPITRKKSAEESAK